MSDNLPLSVRVIVITSRETLFIVLRVLISTYIAVMKGANQLNNQFQAKKITLKNFITTSPYLDNHLLYKLTRRRSATKI